MTHSRKNIKFFFAVLKLSVPVAERYISVSIGSVQYDLRKGGERFFDTLCLFYIRVTYIYEKTMGWVRSKPPYL